MMLPVLSPSSSTQDRPSELPASPTVRCTAPQGFTCTATYMQDERSKWCTQQVSTPISPEEVCATSIISS